MQKWFPRALEEFRIYSVFDLLLEYIRDRRIVLDPGIHGLRTTYHDPCNYGRKSLKAFGHGYFEEGRAITRACCPDFVDMVPGGANNYCCGAGGGAWAMPFAAERVYSGRFKARQIRETGAGLVVTSCHNCRDQLKKSLAREFDLDIGVKYLWEVVADALVLPAPAGGTPEHNREREDG